MSRNKSASKINLTNFDELFQPTVPMDLEKSVNDNQVSELPITLLMDFDKHPYRVEDDERMLELSESIREQGILSPIVVRKKSDICYEIISGHRRKRGAQLAGLETVPVLIKDLSDDEATIAMVNANLQREHLYPSEKAKAYKMKYDAMKHQGKNGGRSLKKLEEESGESQMTIHRLLRLNELIDELLPFVDTGRVGLSQAVDISYLSKEAQGWVLNAMQTNGVRITMKQSARLKDCAQRGELSSVMTALILGGKDRAANKKQITLRRDKIRSFFDADVTDDFIENTIFQLLEKWKTEGQSK